MGGGRKGKEDGWLSLPADLLLVTYSRISWFVSASSLQQVYWFHRISLTDLPAVCLSCLLSCCLRPPYPPPPNTSPTITRV